MTEAPTIPGSPASGADATAAGPQGAYAERARRHRARRDLLRARSVRLATARGATFITAALGFIGIDFLEGPLEAASVALGGLLAVAFVVLVVLHRRARREERWEGALLALAEEGLLRLARKWAELDDVLPADEAAPPSMPADHPYAKDLDVTGRASLLRLLGPVTSAHGRETLLSWLLHESEPKDTRARQSAAGELAGQVGLRHEVAAHGRLGAVPHRAGLDNLLGWAEAKPWLQDHSWIRVAAWITPTLLIGLLAADVFFGAAPFWLLAALAQAELLRRASRSLQREFHVAEGGGSSMQAFVPQLELLAAAEWKDPGLRRLTDRHKGAAEALARLAPLLDIVASRRNLVYATFAPLLLLEVHLASLLDRWRARHGGQLRDWFEALGEWEAHSAIAAVAHDHPEWVFAEIAETATAVEATSLGHPLLRSDACVRNNVSVGPGGRFLLVTGSNMAGKSTLLRALGTNVVLAYAGAPVCATAMRLPRLRLHTSMRIDDSLAEGVSLFMAELLRVRGIIRASEMDGPLVLYLLDEILHGTNSAERRVAARAVVRHLLRVGAIGAVSTHDLTLADATDLEAAADAVHFREDVVEDAEGTRIFFDYRLRSGLATTRNALRLLEAVGLGGLPLEE